MAEGVLFDLGKKVLEVVGSLALQEIKLACGVKAELENLKSKVSTIQAVLLDAEKRGSHNNEVKDWLNKLRDVYLDADDVLDDFSTEALQHKVMAGNKMTKEVRIFFSSSNQLAFNLKMGHRIKEIRERLDAIADDGRTKFHFEENPIESQVMKENPVESLVMKENPVESQVMKQTCSLVSEEDVVGRENDKKEIMELILDADTVENVSIIPIVGIGGVGKTTLAQLIYNDEIVKNNFELWFWIYVSDNFDLKHIVNNMLECLGFWRHEESLEILQKYLLEKLYGKRYFLVLDDVWNVERDKWMNIRNLLMVGARGSRIVVTTRSIEVVKITGTTRPYELKALELEKAWSLFTKMAFIGGKEPENQGIIDLGKEILGKCNGVPLAIKTIGRLLYGRTSENEWQSFLDYILSKLTQEENDISSTLKLSYDYLPSYLKQCFAYCKLFPKDYRINVNTLVNLWVANGFIVLEDSEQRFEDVGRKYFMELLQRSFFQDEENDELGTIKSCKMHNLMHDLAVLVSGTESALFNSSWDIVNEKVCHGSKVRTVLISSVWENLRNLTCNTLISNLKYLRALDLSYLELHVVPRSIGKLKHLRYLDLSGNYYIKILPNSITKMLNLQTLILESCHSLGELPGGIKKLVNLRYLDITNCDELTNMPLEIRHLTSLEIILPCLVVRMESSKGKSTGPSDLKELHNLGGELRIENLGHGKDDVLECKDANLKDKQHLQQLSLKWDDSKWDDSKWDEESECCYKMLEALQPHRNLKWLWLENYMGVRIPSWDGSFTNLVYFVLRKNKRLQHLPSLNQLPLLKFISLHGMEALEYISDEDSVSNVLAASSSSASSSSSSKTPFFPSLSSLVIRECRELKGWWRNSDGNEPSFPRSLSTLRIRDCPNLTSMPPFPYLKERLKLSRCSWKLAICCPLTQLEVLSLKDVEDLELLFQEIRNLPSLKKLRICQCPKLTSLPQEICNLTSLKELRIYQCPELTSLPQEICNLTSLKELRIYQCPKLTSLPQEIYNLTSLRIDQCPLLWQKMKEANR